MKLTAQLKLLPTPDQAESLVETMRAFNAAASFAAQAGFDAGVFSTPSIQKLCYRELRQRFGLSAQMAVRAIGKAAETFRRDKSVCPVFRPDGSMTYDQRILSFKGRDRVSMLTTTAGRQVMSYIFGEYQKAVLHRLKGQVDLVQRGEQFFLYATIDLPEESAFEAAEFLGVDLGIVNLAADSEGEVFSGSAVDANRKRKATARKQFQRKGTKSAKRRLKAMAGRQARFQRQVNHAIAKRIVGKAKALRLGIALENLTGIRGRVEGTVGRKFRRRFGNWGFHQLRSFVEYKARLAGVPVAAVDPRNSSRTCSSCGHCAKGNRPDQATFLCQHCGYSSNADLNAARVLADRARGDCKPPSSAATTSISG